MKLWEACWLWNFWCLYVFGLDELSRDGFAREEPRGWKMEHYTRNTESVTAYCLKCKRFTEHRVDQGRRGPCLDPAHPQPKPKPPKRAPEPGLFDEEKPK